LDGNKRTAFNTAYIFTKLNGFELAGITPDEAVSILAAIAEGQTSESSLVDWVKNSNLEQHRSVLNAEFQRFIPQALKENYAINKALYEYDLKSKTKLTH
jgi:hypothetical protein